MDYMEKARQMRADKDVHYNCAQSVLLAFTEKAGMTDEQGYRLAAHFGHGMRHGSTCGAITGALMALGLMGYDEKAAAAVLRQIRETHGATDCATLLKKAHDAGMVRKDHCDAIVFEMVDMVAKILDEQE